MAKTSSLVKARRSWFSREDVRSGGSADNKATNLLGDLGGRVEVVYRGFDGSNIDWRARSSRRKTVLQV